MHLVGLTIGLFGSLHCLGMCGPIAFALPLRSKTKPQKIMAVFLYHLGRILSYSLIGFGVALIGQGLFILKIQDIISVILGVLLLIIILIPLSLSLKKPRIIKLLENFVLNKFKGLIHNRSQKHFLLIGFFNGLLPCGFVYIALIYGVVQPTVLDTVLIMMLFGLGTVPMMTIAVFWSALIPQNTRLKWQKVFPVFISILGILLILRGLRMDIPMISPSNQSEVPINSQWDCTQ